MSFRRRALFLAGLFVAVSCSDAGNPVAPGGPEPDPGAEGVLAVLTCTVDVRNGTETCERAQPDAADAQLGLVAIGSAAQVTLNTSNTVSTPTSLSYDRSLTNNIYQALGTVDGVTPDPAGIRVWVEPPFMIDTATAGQPTSVTVANADGVLTYKTYRNRPYFQYPGLLQPGATSVTDNWSFTLTNVDAFSYKVFVLAEVQYPQGRIRIEPTTPLLQVNTSDTLTARVRGAFQQLTENLNWTSSDPAVVTVAEVSGADSLGVITGVSEGTAWIKATSAAAPTVRVDSVLVTVNNAPAVPLDSINALQNVSGTVSPARLRQGLAEGDSVVPSQTYDSENGSAVIDADGELTYVADAGFVGQDTVLYDVTDGEWTVKRTLLVNVAPTRYWFVREGASGGGSNTQPLGSINAASDSAASGDTIFVLRNGGNELVGAHTLDAGEALIGHGVPAGFLLEATALNEPGHKDLIFQGQGVGTALTNTGAPTLTVGSNNLVRGVNVSSTDAAAIHGVGFGTLTVADVIVQAGGPALSLANGNLTGSFLALHSTDSDSSGISLTNVGGSLSATASSITGAATTAFSVTGGSVAIDFPGDVTHAGTGRLLQVSSHSGNATFTGALTATAGTGVLLSSAAGDYAFTGAVSLNGGDAGLDVTSSGGSMTFANASISNPTGGPAVHVTGGSPALFYRGSITHNTGRAVLVDGITADSVVLRAAITSGTSGAPTGQGILVQNLSGGLVALDSAKSLFTGANPAVTVNNAAGTVRFGYSMDITTTTGAGFTASGAGTVTASGLNTVATGTGVPVSLTSVNTGAAGVSFSSISTSTGAANGIVLNGISGTGFQATGGTISGTTGAAVQLTNTNNADSVSLRGMTLSRSAGTGAVIAGTTFGKLHALNTSVQASGGPGALALTTGTLSGTYSTVSSNASTGSGVSLTGVSGAFNASGGSINTAGAAAFLVSGGSVSGTFSGTVAQASAVPLLSVSGGHETGAAVLTFAGNVTATNGNGLQFDNADGNYAFTAGVTLNGGDAGIDITNGSGGEFTFPSGANIVSPSTGNLVSILNSAPTFTYSGQFTKANNNVTGILVSNNTGGTITFDGTGTKSISSGTAAAVSLASNTGATINFAGGGLNVASGSGAGFSATGGGTVQVTGLANVVSSTGGGTAVNVQNTNIGGNGMSFQAVTATGGGTNGIVLANTGSGGFQVVGDGASDPGNSTRGRTTARSGGGSITLGSGGSITGKSGDGVSLSSTGPVTLRNLVVTNGAADGIDASSVSGLVLDNLQVTGHANNRGVHANGVSGLKIFHSEIGNNATSASAGASSLYNLQLADVTGTDSIMSSHLHTAFGFVMHVANNSGTLNLRVDNTNIVGATNGIAAGVYPGGTSNVTVNFQNDSIGHSSARGLQSGTTTGSSAVYNLTVNGTAFRNNFVGIDNAHGSSGSYTFSITNNRLQTNVGSSAQAINVNRLGSPSFSSFGLYSGTVSGNVIGTAGVANSGSDVGDGINVESNGSGGITRVAVLNNTIREVGQRAIYLAAVDTDIGGGAAPTLEARVQGNSVANMEGSALHGVQALLGALSTDNPIVCLNISGNTITAPFNGIRVRTSGLPASTPTLRLHGWDGSTAPATYFANLNPAATGSSGNVSYSLGGGTVSSATCTTP